MKEFLVQIRTKDSVEMVTLSALCPLSAVTIAYSLRTETDTVISVYAESKSTSVNSQGHLIHEIIRKVINGN